MPIQFFTHHHMFTYNELSEEAKERALDYYQFKFQDFDIAMEGYHFWFGKKKWDQMMKEIGMEGTAECDLLEWESLIHVDDMTGALEIKGLAVVDGCEEIFLKIIGIDFELGDDIDFYFDSVGDRNPVTALCFEYDEDEIVDERVQKMSHACENFQILFISAGLQSIYYDFDNMASDDYVVEEMVERELLFDVNGNPGLFSFDSIQDIKNGPYCHSVADCQEAWDATLTELEKN